MLGAAHGCSSCMLGAAHGCSSCMLGATIIRRPHATWHAPPMSPPTTWLPLYNLKTQLIGVNQEKHVALFTCSCESGMCFESEWMVCICVLSCFRLCLWVCVCVYEAGSPWTMHVCLKLAQVLQLAASLFVLHFVSWTCRYGGWTAALAVGTWLCSWHLSCVCQMSITATIAGMIGLKWSGLELGIACWC